jgi:hypothetical protein
MNFSIFKKKKKNLTGSCIFKIICGINSLKQTLNLNKSDAFFFFTSINLSTLIAQIKNLNLFRSVNSRTDKYGQVLDVNT